MKILKYFFANFLSGIVLSYLAILILLLNFGLDAPNYVFYIILATSSIGIVISNFLSKKFLKKIYIFDIITYLIFISATLFFIGIEDWKVVFALTLMSMLYSILPTIVFTITLNLREILSKK
ncbi:MAG: hypothetical protein A2488_01195 [Candidatus Magasanikbacteria bacterium RIFOXYC12_FULL_32_21b]|nr:MAG: hypothetical protein A2488_01195 [Candidatus Magasanikbacteria bacterium RIFOXYC12_FULL_32_21b]